MSYRKMLVRALDRPGGRYILGRVASHFVRKATGDDLEIFYRDGLWTRRTGPLFLPDSQNFDYGYEDFASWVRLPERYATDTQNYWFRHYTPNIGDVIVDVGAGHGEDTLTFSRAVGKTGSVIAIEAHPIGFRILQNFCRLNRLENVRPVHVALMEKPAMARIVESPSSWMENALDPTASTGIPVEADSFDSVCERLGIKRIDFLKMNIEGAETSALAGMTKTIAGVRQICVACHDFRADMGHGEHFRTLQPVQQFLREAGFTVARRADAAGAVRDHIFGFRLEMSPSLEKVGR